MQFLAFLIVVHENIFFNSDAKLNKIGMLFKRQF